jgi:nicotinamidase-related amidase
MEPPTTLRDEPVGPAWVHLCVDMQRLFWPGTDWGLEWMPRVAPNIVAICERHPARTVFTRFVPAPRPGEGHGTWRRYYRRWASMTIQELGPEFVDLIPELRRFAPPAEVVDKPVYSPWLGSDLHARLRARGTDTLVITGGETDMCVLCTVLGAADHGYRTIVLRDALCSSSDAAHDATLDLFSRRFGQHIEVTTAEDILERLGE